MGISFFCVTMCVLVVQLSVLCFRTGLQLCDLVSLKLFQDIFILFVGFIVLFITL